MARELKAALSIRNLGMGKRVYAGDISVPMNKATSTITGIKDDLWGREIPVSVRCFDCFDEGKKCELVIWLIAENVYFEFSFPKGFRGGPLCANGIRMKKISKRYPAGRFVKWSAHLRIK